VRRSPDDPGDDVNRIAAILLKQLKRLEDLSAEMLDASRFPAQGPPPSRARTDLASLGVDLDAGVGFPLGFAYATRLYPIGVALMLADNTFLGVYGGIGSEGVTTVVPGSFELPAEPRLEIDTARAVPTGVKANVDWFPTNAFRRGGSILSPTADALGVRLRAHRACVAVRASRASGGGYFAAVTWQEVLRSAWVGLTFGVEADFGG
jgi:hypothetical protein